ncbi:Uncharacterised protein [Shigella sonnei]|nr:Uncharacterised protein [Shigella sonnei]
MFKTIRITASRRVDNLKHGVRQKRIFVIVNFADESAFGRINNEVAPDEISNKSGVEYEPAFRTLFTDRWLQNFPLVFRQCVGFFQPQHIDPLQ